MLIDLNQTSLPVSYPTGAQKQGPAAPPAPEPETNVWGAAFRQNNILMSAASSLAWGVENDVRDPGYSAWDEIAGTPYEQFWENFADSNNPDYTAALKRQIDQEQQDRDTLAASGWAGFGASFVAALADPTVFIPGVGVASKAKQGYTFGRFALAGATAGGFGVTAQEAGLQATQELRTAEESALNIGIGTILGGLLGSGAYAMLSPAQRATAARAYDRMGGFDGQPSSLSAAAVGKFTRDDLSVSGGAASALAGATRFLNPNLRSLYRASPDARQYAMALYDNTIGVKVNEKGIAVAPGGAAEVDARRMVGERLGLFLNESQRIYAEMKKAGTNLARGEFNEAVAKAARRGDADPNGNMYVTRAAQALRSKVLEPFKQDLINAGLLPEDADITTALSYFPKVRNTDMLIARGAEWKERVTNYFAQQTLPEQFAKDKKTFEARIAKLQQQIEDLQLDAPTRARTLQEIEAAGVRLDEANAENIERVSRINELRRENTPEARAEIARIRGEGGQSLKDYLAQRTDLRRRRRNVDWGIAGTEARAEALRQRLTDIEDANMRALATLVKRGQIVEQINQKWDAGKIEATLDDLTERFEAMVRQADKSEQKARAAVEKMRQKVKDKTIRLREQEADFKAKAKDAKKNDPMAKPALDQKAYEAQQQRLELEIKADEKELAMLERIATTQANYAEKIGSLHARMEAVADLDPEARIAEAREVTEAMVRERSATSLARGERAQRILERMEQLDPEKVQQRVALAEARKAKMQSDFLSKWGDGEAPDFRVSAAQIADDAFEVLIGRDDAGRNALLPEFHTPVKRGPLKERSLNIPDELEEDFLINDVDEVIGRYARVAAGSVAIQKMLQRFGFRSLTDMQNAVKASYADIAAAVEEAATVEQALARVGKEPGMLDNFRAWAGKEDVAVSKEKLLRWLDNDMRGALEDLNAGIELQLGTYKLKENNNTWQGRMVQRLNLFNYTRLSGNFGLSSLSELYNGAFSNGVTPFLREGVAPMLKRLDGIKIQRQEAKLAGLIAERVTNQRLYAIGEIGDPFARGNVLDRMLRNLSSLATRLNGVALMQDIAESIASHTTINRIIKGSMSGADDEFLARIGLGPTERSRIAAMFEKHGDIEDDVLYLPNTEMWDDQYAVEAFRNALNGYVGRAVVRPGTGDLPLAFRTPTGKALFQFRSFAVAGHQRTTLRALQEGPGAIVRGVVGTTAVGMLISYLAALRSGQEGYERWRRQAENPGWWIAEGFDRGGFMPMIFEVANTMEKASGTVIGSTFNPIKTTAAMPFGGAAYGGESSRNIGRSFMSAMLGPTFGLLDTVPRAMGGGASVMAGEDPSAAQQRAAISLIPLLGTMPVAKEVLQMLTGDSPYLQ